MRVVNPANYHKPQDIANSRIILYVVIKAIFGLYLHTCSLHQHEIYSLFYKKAHISCVYSI